MELPEPSQVRFPGSHATPAATPLQQPDTARPSDYKVWNVEDIAEWLKIKGVDKDVVAELRQEVCFVQTASKKRGDPFPDEGKRQGTEPCTGPEFLIELHNKLWGRKDLFCQVFRAVDLTKEDFIELQSELHHLNPSRHHKSYLSKKENILEIKMNFLRSRTATHPLVITTDSLVPKVVLSECLVPAGAMDVEVNIKSEGTTDNQNAMDGEVLNSCVGDEGEDDNADDVSYIAEDAAALSYGPTVLPCTIRYMDLTCLNLQIFSRVSQVLLIRDEWDAVIDIFNKGEMGIRGGAVWTGQSGIGETALLYFILVTCLIKAQPFVFQDFDGLVYIVGDEVRQQMDSRVTVKVPGPDFLALIDGDGEFCGPDYSIIEAQNVRVALLTSSPRSKNVRQWLTQFVQNRYASYVVGPWQWNEIAITSIFLSELDITLRRLWKATKFCGFIPQSVFKAVVSPKSLEDAMSMITIAITQCDIPQAIRDVVGDPFVPHPAFMIYPADEERFMLKSQVKPVSDWALGLIFNTLESRGAEAAYELYRRIEGYPPASAFSEQIWEHFCSGDLPI